MDELFELELYWNDLTEEDQKLLIILLYHLLSR